MRMQRKVRVLAMTLCAALGGCSGMPLDNSGGTIAAVPDREAAAAVLVADHLETVSKLVKAPPAEQAEIFIATRRDYELAPTPSHQLRYALALAVPGHVGSDPQHAQQLLRDILSGAATVPEVEQALAFLELQRVEQQLSLAAENRRLQESVERGDRERLATLSRRLQSETEENARLRKELEAAQAKLDAIANIERSMNERKPAPEGRTP
jgi:hypothetical protein